MDARNRSGWGLPLVFAVGAFAYYCASMRLSNDSGGRRRAILQRLYDGTTPRALLEEGYAPRELLEAGVPSESLYANERVTPATSPSESPRSGETTGRSVEGHGLMTRVYDSFVHVTNTIQAASETLADNLRGRSTSTSILSEPKTSVREHAGRAAPPSTATDADASNSTGLLSPSIRLAAAASFPEREPQSAASPSISQERSFPRTPASATRVRVAALSATVARGYVEESCGFRYPLEVLRFLHEDGTRLSIMAEDCRAVERGADGLLTTDVYVQRSLARARAAAEECKAYFRVKLSTAARSIATTIMESYVNTHVGPSPVILASFYLVDDDVAYTIQLQTHTGAYEERLADLLYTAQSARLNEGDGSSANWQRKRGHNAYKACVDGVSSTYIIEVPVDMVVSATKATPQSPRTLVLAPCCPSAEDSFWKAIVTLSPASALRSSRDGSQQRVLLRDTHVSIELSLQGAAKAAASSAPLPALLAGVSARVATSADAPLPSAAYVSPALTLALPPPEHFAAVVCENPYEPSVSLFISPANAAGASSADDVFEVEMHCLHNVNEATLQQLFHYLATLLLTPSRPQRGTNAADQPCFSIEGLAVAPAETTLRVYGVQVCEGSWLIVRWLHADSAVLPRELEQYRAGLVEGVAC